MTSFIPQCLALILFGLAGSAGWGSLLKAVPAKIDMNKAYLIVELDKTDPFIVPVLTLARYDRAVNDVLGEKIQNPGKEKILPNRIAVARNEILKEKKNRLFLLEMEPGDWVIEGMAGTSFSLGSYLIVLKAGEVVDLGVVSAAVDWRPGDEGQNLTAQMLLSASLFGVFAKKPDPTPLKISIRRRSANDIQLPKSLLVLDVHPPTLQRGYRFGNHLGGLVNRAEGRAGRPGSNLYEAIKAQEEGGVDFETSPSSNEHTPSEANSETPGTVSSISN